MGPDSCGCRTRDNMMLLSLILASVAALVSSEAGITYTAEPFKAAQQQLTDITYTAEPFKTASKTEIKPISTYTSSLPQTYMPISNWYYNARPVSNIVPASTRAVLPSISSPVV